MLQCPRADQCNLFSISGGRRIYTLPNTTFLLLFLKTTFSIQYTVKTLKIANIVLLVLDGGLNKIPCREGAMDNCKEWRAPPQSAQRFSP